MHKYKNKQDKNVQGTKITTYQKNYKNKQKTTITPMKKSQAPSILPVDTYKTREKWTLNTKH